MVTAASEHRFYAPIEGKSHSFIMQCHAGNPVAIYAYDSGAWPKPDPDVARQLADLNDLMRKGLPWGAVCTQHQGNIGAVIEAAELRRAEIYGQQSEVPA